MKLKKVLIGISAAAFMTGAALAADVGVKAGVTVNDTSGNPVGQRFNDILVVFEG